MITEFDMNENICYRREENIEWIRKQESKCSDCKGIERLVKAPPGRLNGSLVIEKGCR